LLLVSTDCVDVSTRTVGRSRIADVRKYCYAALPDWKRSQRLSERGIEEQSAINQPPFGRLKRRHISATSLGLELDFHTCSRHTLASLNPLVPANLSAFAARMLSEALPIYAGDA
jgi:hypothetical protein